MQNDKAQNRVQDTSLVSQRISNEEPVPTATCLPHEQEATMLDKESTWHFSAAVSKHFLGVCVRIKYIEREVIKHKHKDIILSKEI